jgi:transcription initiation factor IIE alpha subunit
MNYTCPKCKSELSAKEWDKATEKYYNSTDTTSINDEAEREACHFICPACKESVGYYELANSGNEDVEMKITITTKEYEELLEFKAMHEGLCK